MWYEVISLSTPTKLQKYLNHFDAISFVICIVFPLFFALPILLHLNAHTNTLTLQMHTQELYILIIIIIIIKNAITKLTNKRNQYLFPTTDIDM